MLASESPPKRRISRRGNQCQVHSSVGLLMLSPLFPQSILLRRHLDPELCLARYLGGNLRGQTFTFKRKALFAPRSPSSPVPELPQLHPRGEPTTASARPPMDSQRGSLDSPRDIVLTDWGLQCATRMAVYKDPCPKRQVNSPIWSYIRVLGIGGEHDEGKPR